MKRDQEPLISDITDPRAKQVIATKDQEIQKLKNRIADLEAVVREPNFPPCCAIVHHNIAKEIPEERQGLVRFLFFAFILNCPLLLWNCITSFIVTNSASTGDSATADSNFKSSQWLGIAYLIGVPIAFPLWYYPVYRTMMVSDGSRYFLAFIGLGIGLLASVWGILGVNGYGAAGIMFLIDAEKYRASKTPMYCALAATVMWCLLCAALVISFINLIRCYRADKASVQGAVDITKIAVEHAASQI